MRLWCSTRRRRRFAVGAVLACAVIASAAGATRGAAQAPAGSTMTIQVLSNRADLVSSDNALVRVLPATGVSPSDVQVTLNGASVTDAFAVRPNGQLEGLVSGLRTGPNTLTATSPGGGATIDITNHPKGGPVFAGPQVQPWPCTTQNHGLGPAQDAQCNAATTYSYRYKSSLTGQFATYDPANPPADVATTTNDQGTTVPYVVRVERGHDGPRHLRRRRPVRPDAAVAALGAAAGVEPQAVRPVRAELRAALPPGAARGRALGPGALRAASRSRRTASTRWARTATTVVSAEALMMLKEHISETYGSIRYTLSDGCSGGSIQQHNIAAAYPGLLDGIMPSCSYPDVTTTGNEVIDCKLLLHYFNDTSPHLWAAQAQRALVGGSQTGATCHAWVNVFRFDQSANPSQQGNTFTDCAVPPDQVYNADTNPDGVRCSVSDYQVAIWGRRAEDGFAKRPLDNVGDPVRVERAQLGA